MPTRLKAYRPKWSGELILACRKCQRKLKKSDKDHELSNLKKTAKRESKRSGKAGLHVLSVPCMDLCPKGGVTVCFPRVSPDELFILWKQRDLEELVQQSAAADATLTSSATERPGFDERESDRPAAD